MERRKNNLRSSFSTIGLFILVILLCAPPDGWAGDYDGGTYDVTITEDHLNIGLNVTGTTVNLYADISTYVIVGSGSFLNIYSGNVGGDIKVVPGPPSGVVTVYGTNFALDGVPLDPSITNFSVEASAAKSLTGKYGDNSDINLLFNNSFNSDVVIYLESPEISVEQVEIDIKPGSYPNSINLKSNGVVPVAVLTDGDFEAANIDPATVEFAEATPLRWTYEDVDDDGDEDILFHFKTQELNLDENSTEAELTGQTNDGVDISGIDEVRIVPSKSKKNKKK